MGPRHVDGTNSESSEVDAGAVAATMVARGKPERIAEAVREARIEAIRVARAGSW